MPKDEWGRETRKVRADGVRRLREEHQERQALEASRRIQQLREQYQEEQTPQASREMPQEHQGCEEEGHPPKCPKCGRPMVLRMATKYTGMGAQFWGCSGYPACKAAVAVGDHGELKKSPAQFSVCKLCGVSIRKGQMYKHLQKTHKVKDVRYKRHIR